MAAPATSPVRRSTFWKVIAIALAVVVGLGVLIQRLNAGHDRPEGAAERWLAAVGETGRKGVSADARERAEKIGPVNLAASLIPADHDERRSLFADLEVGKAIDAEADTVRIPFQLHQRLESGMGPIKRGSVVLQRTPDRWRVAAVDARRPGEKVPSEGGDPPSRAPLALWFGAIGLGVVLAICAHLVVRYADRTAQRALTSAAR